MNVSTVVIDGNSYKVEFEYLKLNDNTDTAISIAGVYLRSSYVNLLGALNDRVLNEIAKYLLRTDIRCKYDNN